MINDSRTFFTCPIFTWTIGGNDKHKCTKIFVMCHCIPWSELNYIVRLPFSPDKFGLFPYFSLGLIFVISLICSEDFCTSLWIYFCTSPWIYFCTSLWIYICTSPWIYFCTSLWIYFVRPCGYMFVDNVYFHTIFFFLSQFFHNLGKFYVSPKIIFADSGQSRK